MFKLISNILDIENKTSLQKLPPSNLLMDRAKLHVNIPTEIIINIHTLLDKLAKVLSDSARGKFNSANAGKFEK